MSRLNRDQLVQLAKSEISEINARELKEWLDDSRPLTLVDVREREEFVQGHIPTAVFIPRGYLELQIEQHQPDRQAPVVIYCAGGVRSALAARNLKEMGYKQVISLSGGFNGWKNGGYTFKIPTVLTEGQRLRYSRHTLLREVGEQGQIKLLEAKVLLIGAGGLGSPAAMYLAAAGVGTLGIVDFDVVDFSNLQRQLLHGTKDVGRPKVESAADRIHDINPDITVNKHPVPLTSENALEIIRNYDIVLNGSDNFPTRYLVNDACHMLGKPLVDGSIFMFEGQATVYHAGPARTRDRGRPLLSLPLSRTAPAGRGAQLRRGWRLGRAAGSGRFHAGHRGDQADPGDRRAAGGTAAAHRHAGHELPHPQDPAQSGLPALRRPPVGDRTDRLRPVLRLSGAGACGRSESGISIAKASLRAFAPSCGKKSTGRREGTKGWGEGI